MNNKTTIENIKVLYVEDECITRNQVYKFLKKRVGKVITAKDGEDGIEKYREYQPDIIITDLIMPGINGIEMMKKLREKGARCPAIITSALSDAQTILETVDLKIVKYLIKPIDVDILMKTLEQISGEIIEQKEDVLVVNQDLILTEDAKNQLELKIRNLFSKYLKKITGKGAKFINVFITGKEIEILLKGSFTTLEENLLATAQLNTGVELVRKTIYENTINEIEQEISKLIDRRIEVKEIDIYTKERFERVLLQII